MANTSLGIFYPSATDNVKSTTTEALQDHLQKMAATTNSAILSEIGKATEIIELTGGEDLNDFRTTGRYILRLASEAAPILNIPPGMSHNVFYLRVVAHTVGGFQYVMQDWSGLSDVGSNVSSGYFRRNTSGASGALWIPWRKLDNDFAAAQGGAGIANVLRVQEFKDAYPPINTNGRAAVALRFDHGLANFNSKIRPLLEARNLPYCLALSSRHWGAPENAGVTAAMVNSWNSLCEVWNHGAGNHQDASDIAGLTDMIVTGKTELQAQLPNKTIWGFIPPGVGGTNYGGFNGGDSPEAFYGTLAGQLILENHAVSSGAYPGTSYRPLDGEVRQGMGHAGLETRSVSSLQSLVNTAIADKTGLQLMTHPSRLDEAGYHTTAELTQMLDYIVAKRDAGELVVLSPYEMMVADLGLTRWFKGTYTGSDVYADTAAGLYFVPDATGIANWPTEMSGVGGFLEVKSEAGIVTLTIDGYGARPYTFRTYRNSVLNETFHPWERTANLSEVNSAKWFKGLFTGSSVFGATAPGQYYVTEAKAGALTDWPAEMSGVGGFLTVSIQDGRKSFRVEGYGARPYIFTTQTNSVMNNTFHPWERLATKTELDAVAAGIRPIGLNRAVLLDAFTKRRGGRIGVQGKGVVALRLDDPINGLINSGVADALKDLQIPASAVHCSGSFTAPDLIALSDLGSWDHVASWGRRQGMEVWHHGGNHKDASGVSALTRETVTSLSALEASLPSLEVNKWAQPGVGGTNYDGFASSDRPELFFDHEAGKLIARGHAVASGYMDGWSRPLDGKPRDGLGHWTVDTPSALTSAYSYVDEAAMLGTGLAIMLHPNNLDREGDYSTSAAFIDFLEYLAQLRDEGKIEILTLSGLLCADASTSWRAQLIRDAGFALGLSRYTGATDWTVTGGVASTSGTSLLGQIFAVSRHGWVLGGTMQLVAKVRATAGAVVRLHQSSLNNQAAWMTEQDVAVPASAEWQTVRLNCCVPKNLASSDYVVTRIGRVSGGTLEVDSFEYLPV